jgi:hypothetical protein
MIRSSHAFFSRTVVTKPSLSKVRLISHMQASADRFSSFGDNDRTWDLERAIQTPGHGKEREGRQFGQNKLGHTSEMSLRMAVGFSVDGVRQGQARRSQ